MLVSSPWSRTRMDTFAAKPDRNTAACPAELPPPTSATCSPRQSRASMGEAQYHTPRPSNASRLGIARSPIARPTGHDDRPGRRAAAIGQLEREGARRAVESHDGARDHDLGPELLRLHEGPAGEGPPEMPSGKPR